MGKHGNRTTRIHVYYDCHEGVQTMFQAVIITLNKKYQQNKQNTITAHISWRPGMASWSEVTKTRAVISLAPVELHFGDSYYHWSSPAWLVYGTHIHFPT
jgi:hypothetical protein